jgi:hypothetical protein
MYMTKLVDRPLIRGAARLLDIGGVLAWRGARDPADASARLMDEAWAMFGVALKDALPSTGYTNEDTDALAGEEAVNNDPASAGQRG